MEHRAEFEALRDELLAALPVFEATLATAEAQLRTAEAQLRTVESKLATLATAEQAAHATTAPPPPSTQTTAEAVTRRVDAWLARQQPALTAHLHDPTVAIEVADWLRTFRERQAVAILHPLVRRSHVKLEPLLDVLLELRLNGRYGEATRLFASYTAAELSETYPAGCDAVAALLEVGNAALADRLLTALARAQRLRCGVDDPVLRLAWAMRGQGELVEDVVPDTDQHGRWLVTVLPQRLRDTACTLRALAPVMRSTPWSAVTDGGPDGRRLLGVGVPDTRAHLRRAARRLDRGRFFDGKGRRSAIARCVLLTFPEDASGWAWERPDRWLADLLHPQRRAR